jgi:hypothetical protein
MQTLVYADVAQHSPACVSSWAAGTQCASSGNVSQMATLWLNYLH